MEFQSKQKLQFTVEAPGRKSRLDNYLWDKTDELALESAEILHNPNKPLPEYGVLIPVAAHQESKRIYKSMSEYAQQEGVEDFVICLNLNYPFENSDSREVEATRQAVEQAIIDFGQLDIRYIELSYAEDETTIGRIRKDLWDAVALLARAEGIYDQPDGEFIAINHDIDTESIGKHYVRNIQRYYEREKSNLACSVYPDVELEVRATQVKHAYPFETHPNIAKVILWQDFTFRQAARGGMYEEGMVIPISSYAKAGGFLADKSTYETHGLTDSAIKNGKILGIAGTAMDTSARRYIARLDETGSSSIWSDDTFGNNDSCRDSSLLPSDISFERMEEIIFEDLDKNLVNVVDGITADEWNKLCVDYMLSGNMSDEELSSLVWNLIDPKLKLAKAVLARVSGSELLTSFVDRSVLTENVESIVASIKNRYNLSVFEKN